MQGSISLTLLLRYLNVKPPNSYNVQYLRVAHAFFKCLKNICSETTIFL